MKKIDFCNYIKDVYLNDAYYTVRWSKYYKYNKYDIIKKIPALSGIFVVFYLTESKKLMPFLLGYSWVGSLRHDLRQLSDPLVTEKEICEILENNECYFKYLIVPSYADLLDLYEYYKYYYRNIFYTQMSENRESGRYNNVYVKEYKEK